MDVEQSVNLHSAKDDGREKLRLLSQQNIDRVRRCIWRKWDLIESYCPGCTLISFILLPHQAFHLEFHVRGVTSERWNQVYDEIAREIEELIPGYQGFFSLSLVDNAAYKFHGLRWEFWIGPPSSHELFLALSEEKG